MRSFTHHLNGPARIGAQWVYADDSSSTPGAVTVRHANPSDHGTRPWVGLGLQHQLSPLQTPRGEVDSPSPGTVWLATFLRADRRADLDVNVTR